MPDDSWADWETQPATMKDGKALTREDLEAILSYTGAEPEARRKDMAAQGEREGQPQEVRKIQGPTAIEMLIRPVEGGAQDSPELGGDLWYPTEGPVGPGDALDTDPDQEGPDYAAEVEPDEDGPAWT